MKRIKTSESKLWKIVNTSVMTQKNIRKLSTFKSGPLNHKISLWNPQTNGVRYLKALIYNLASGLTKEQWQKIDRVRNRSLGNPIVVNYNKREICLDYLQALYELEFIEKHMPLNNSNILEIGAGYGRTCHAIVSNHDIKNYCIVDLENCLRLSREYLKRVLSRQQFSKINFILAKHFSLLDAEYFNLSVNINSFAEMDPEVVRCYLDYINERSNYFYVKNPVGKYLDKTLDNHAQGGRLVKIALKTGVLLDVIDIHNSETVLAQSKKFIKAYSPGPYWRCAADSWAKPWSFYWNAFFAKR